MASATPEPMISAPAARTPTALMRPEAEARLAKVVTHHAGAGAYDRARLRAANLPTLEGQNLPIVVAQATITAGGAFDTAVDLEATSGAVHRTGGVLVPPGCVFP